MSTQVHTIRDVIANQLIIKQQKIIICVDTDSLTKGGWASSLIKDIITIQNICATTIVLSFGKGAVSFSRRIGEYDILSHSIKTINSALSYVKEYDIQKIVIVSEVNGLFDIEQRLISHMTFDEALTSPVTNINKVDIILFMLFALRDASTVRRIHIIGSSVDGALLLELLTAAGIGTMIHRGKTEYKKIRFAFERDVHDIYCLMRDYGTTHTTVSKDEIRENIYLYRLLIVDTQIKGVLKIGSPVGSLTVLVVDPRFRVDREHFAFLRVYRSICGYVGGQSADRKYMPKALYTLSRNKKTLALLEQLDEYRLSRSIKRPCDDTGVVSGV